MVAVPSLALNLKSDLEAAVCAVRSSFHNGTKPAKLRAPYKVYNFY